MAITEHLEHIRQRIGECGVSLPRLALAADLSNKTLRHYRLERWNPTADTLIKLEAALDALERAREGRMATSEREIKFPDRRRRKVRHPSMHSSDGEAA